MLGLIKGTIKLCEHETMWEENASQTILLLKQSFGENAVDIQHIGSTAIKRIKAKPIIDIVVGVSDMTQVKIIISSLERVGIIHRPNNDQPEYMMFIIGDLSIGLRTHHIHVVPYDGEEWNNQLNFRDFMNEHLKNAKEYEAFKIDLMNLYKNNRAMYTDSKTPYIMNIFRQAAEWRQHT